MEKVTIPQKLQDKITEYLDMTNASAKTLCDGLTDICTRTKGLRFSGSSLGERIGKALDELNEIKAIAKKSANADKKAVDKALAEISAGLNQLFADKIVVKYDSTSGHMSDCTTFRVKSVNIQSNTQVKDSVVLLGEGFHIDSKPIWFKWHVEELGHFEIASLGLLSKTSFWFADEQFVADFKERIKTEAEQHLAGL